MKKLKDLHFDVYAEFYKLLETLFPGCEVINHSSSCDNAFYIGISDKDDTSDISLDIEIRSCLNDPEENPYEDITIDLRCKYLTSAHDRRSPHRGFNITIPKDVFDSPACLKALKNLIETQLPPINCEPETKQWNERCAALKKVVKQSGVKQFCTRIGHTRLTKEGVPIL